MLLRFYCFVLLCTAVLGSGCSAPSESPGPPNFVIIFADDLGYGDLATFGNPTIQTPHLDRMAAEGQKWTSFYVAASICTPSRAALMTGRLPIRSGMVAKPARVLFPNSGGGLPASEITIAEALKEKGYATACIGKWHLGHLPQFLPMQQGFDSYFGIPYSNDMDPVAGVVPKGRDRFYPAKIEYWNVPLMLNEEIIERPAHQPTLTKRYAEEAVSFIHAHKDQPFFLYLPHTMPHVPLFASEQFTGKSRRGLYGDVVEELDWSVGQVLDTLHDLGLDRKTLVIFTSDNGPWLSFREQGGSAGLLRGGKGEAFEGGMRVPTIFWRPGTIQPGVVTDMGSTLDLFPTVAKLAGAAVPIDRVLDGHDLTPVLEGTGSSGRDSFIYYRATDIFAARKGPFKAYFYESVKEIGGKHKLLERPWLYHLEHDPSERFNIAEQHPEVVEEIRKIVQQHEATVKPVVNQIEIRLEQE